MHGVHFQTHTGRKRNETVNCTDSDYSGYNTCDRVAYNCGNMVDWKIRRRKNARMVGGSMKNKEGYPDPTAETAIKNICSGAGKNPRNKIKGENLR